MAFFIVAIYVIICVCIGYAAESRGGSATGWFLLSIVTSPVLAVIILFLLPERSTALNRARRPPPFVRDRRAGGSSAPWAAKNLDPWPVTGEQSVLNLVGGALDG
jgi:hypothetical protein